MKLAGIETTHLGSSGLLRSTLIGLCLVIALSYDQHPMIRHVLFMRLSHKMWKIVTWFPKIDNGSTEPLRSRSNSSDSIVIRNARLSKCKEGSKRVRILRKCTLFIPSTRSISVQHHGAHDKVKQYGSNDSHLSLLFPLPCTH